MEGTQVAGEVFELFVHDLDKRYVAREVLHPLHFRLNSTLSLKPTHREDTRIRAEIRDPWRLLAAIAVLDIFHRKCAHTS